MVALENTQAKGLLKMMRFENGKCKAKSPKRKMINGMNASYNASLYFVDKTSGLIYEKGGRLVDMIKI